MTSTDTGNAGTTNTERSARDIESGSISRLKGSDDDINTTPETVPTPASASRLGHQTTLRHYGGYVWMTITLLILLIGIAASASFVYIGISGAREDELARFDRKASELLSEIIHTWDEFELAALWIHNACRNRDIDRKGFRELYEYIRSTGLNFDSASFMMNVTHDERAAMEAETRAFLQERRPGYPYPGFVGFGQDPITKEFSIQQQREAPHYFPVHFVEPVEGNEPILDLNPVLSDWFTSAKQALDTWIPALSPRKRHLQETDPSAYSVFLLHPGIPLSTEPELQPRDLAVLTIRIPAFLERAIRSEKEKLSVFIYDSTDSKTDPIFLGGIRVDEFNKIDNSQQLTFETEQEMSSIDGAFLETRQITIASRKWTIIVVSDEYNLSREKIFLILGGITICLASVILAAGVYTNMRRVAKYNEMKSEAEAEKAAMIVENAKQATEAERQLNDYIAHEVRNPLAAAMSGCSFVKCVIDEETSWKNEEARQSAKEDLDIVESSLQFINELLRNMLDSHRASSKKLEVECAPTDVLQDVLRPVDAMLYRRGSKIKVMVDCPEHLVVITDRLRLKQVMLNLGRNSTKFVQEGFIRLRAALVQSNVRLYVEDSGPGIPAERMETLFQKFQQTNDSLSQGTGVGLSLCKQLVEYLGGEIWLDQHYDSGVKGFPGSRFVIDLKLTPVQLTDEALDSFHNEDQYNSNIASDPTTSTVDPSNPAITTPTPMELPEELSVLFVDDDFILRKLFVRTVRKVAPEWDIEEASNGETAIRLVATKSYDLIFMDHYMSSAEKQMLGTEATRALRALGVESRICGLSANDIAEEFLEAGADSFILKPFPCEKEALKTELCRLLVGK